LVYARSSIAIDADENSCYVADVSMFESIQRVPSFADAWGPSPDAPGQRS
jgi:hypothetical protein